MRVLFISVMLTLSIFAKEKPLDIFSFSGILSDKAHELSFQSENNKDVLKVEEDVILLLRKYLNMVYAGLPSMTPKEKEWVESEESRIMGTKQSYYFVRSKEYQIYVLYKDIKFFQKRLDDALQQNSINIRLKIMSEVFYGFRDSTNRIDWFYERDLISFESLGAYNKYTQSDATTYSDLFYYVAKGYEEFVLAYLQYLYKKEPI